MPSPPEYVLVASFPIRPSTTGPLLSPAQCPVDPLLLPSLHCPLLHCAHHTADAFMLLTFVQHTFYVTTLLTTFFLLGKVLLIL